MESLAICELCRQQVRPGAPGVLCAAPLITVQTSGAPPKPGEGIPVWFHVACFRRAGYGYRVLPQNRPAPPDASA